MSIPIKLLVDEGLLDISNTTLEDKDLKDEYVVTFLGGSGGSENCEQITSSASWANDKPIYLCMRSDGTGANLAFIDPSKYGNLTTVSKEPYYFNGSEPDNYVYLGNDSWGTPALARIFKIERDDSLVLLVTSYEITAFIPANNNNYKKNNNGSYFKTLTHQEICQTIEECIYYHEPTLYMESGNTLSINIENLSYIGRYNRKIYTLKPCWKISSGSGSIVDPFKLTSNCS